MLHISKPNEDSTALKLEGTIAVNIVEGSLDSLRKRLLDQVENYFNKASKEFQNNK
jgi:hypothetical protein